MAIDMFWKLGDIKGESRDSMHKEEIDIQTFQWGMSQSGSMHQGGGGGAGKVSIGNLSLSKSLDKSSPNLMMACSSGKHYQEATLTVRKAGGSVPVEYMIITLKEVMIASYQTDAGNSDESVKENIALNFATVEVSYQPQKADGSKEGGPVKYGWNIRENVKI
ncbi:Hcp family type VI secretion system effector [Pseudomonas sp. ICMP 561]|uniref:Hcp family type VI secretion system effector n=1 Tax=Pseudomonas sp. ICMP 561 TaxID=1718918 RepID=UPI000C06C8CE|nr:type VI secretion system tube protein Hcp [Pseudomonas sp. ICMP 561]PHN32289.1 Hcp1 family type VI secretion system effector [Pseudomonas sp. ICMP 561]